MNEFGHYLERDTVWQLEEYFCLLRNLNPIISGRSYDVNMHGFCCYDVEDGDGMY